ncbi:MAG: cellulase, partial [Bacteroidetes bacterium]
TAIRSFYFQRASMPIENSCGGTYSRAGGHPDTACPYHPSTGRSSGTLDSPGGWYDAGDYGKYIVNAAISVSQMLNLLELYPEVIGDSRLNIPESGNGINDLLDEIIYELDWMVTMQDTEGGVFHKLTAKNFAGFIMPGEYDLERLIIGKGTAATLDYAATMALAARVLSSTHPVWSEAAIYSAEKAWKWAVDNDSVPYRNPPDVHTGEYGDDEFSDDFYWAASELYVTTGKKAYLDHLADNHQPYIHQITNSWKFFIRNMGFHSLLAHRQKLDSGLINLLVQKHMELADQILDRMEAIPYHIGLDHFEWGSNSDVLNQAMILCYAHHLSGSGKYLDGVIHSMDYILGKNATGYSFLTGMGSEQVMNPHHRPSGADGIAAPVPGFILGGPNDHRQDRRSVKYHSDRPAKAFEDVEASYASNEVCINWNAPAVFVLGYLESVMN